MLRRIKVSFSWLLVTLAIFFPPCCKLASCQTGEEWMSKETEPYKAAKYEEAMKYYTKAIELNPKLTEPQENWVRQRLRSGKPADLLERVDQNLAGESLPLRTDLIEKHNEQLLLSKPFIQELFDGLRHDPKQYPKGIIIKNSLIVGDLDLSNADLSAPLGISKCIFLGKVALNHSDFKRDVNLVGSHFLRELNAHSSKFKGNVLLNKTTFEGPVNFQWANIAGKFQADDANFENKDTDINFDSMKVGQSASFNNARFQGGVSFVRMDVHGQFEANEAQFVNQEKTANFYCIKVGHDIVLKGGVSFYGQVNFVAADVGSHFKAPEANFLGEADFKGLKSAQSANFNDAFFRAGVRFRNCNLGDVKFARTKFEDKVDLDGLNYKRFYTDGGDRDCLSAIKILDKMERYCPQPYKELESCYTGLGYKDEADEVFVKGKKRQMQEQSWKLLSWDLPTNLLKFTFLGFWVGHGRYLHRVFFPAIAVILIGMFIFSRPHIFQNEHKLSFPTAFWYSLGAVLPFTTLGTDKLHVLKRGAYLSIRIPNKLAHRLPPWLVRRFPLKFPVQTYHYIHQICGFILLTTVIAAIPELIK